MESSQRLGRHRWVAEACLSWLLNNRRPIRRHERKAEHFQAFTDLGGALLTYRPQRYDWRVSAGYALFLRAFSVTRGWLSGPSQITAGHGSSAMWPGDTTGLSALSPTDVEASWGSDYPGISGNQDAIYAVNIAATLP